MYEDLYESPDTRLQKKLDLYLNALLKIDDPRIRNEALSLSIMPLIRERADRRSAMK